MTAPVLSGQTRQVKTSRERAKKQREQELLDAIPPELLLVRDNAIRYERNGPIYATDGKVGLLKRVVIDETAGEVVELIAETLDSGRLVVLPLDSEPFMISFHMVGNTGAVVETGQGTRPSIGTRFAWYPLRLVPASLGTRFCAVPDMRPVRYTAAHSQLLVKA